MSARESQVQKLVDAMMAGADPLFNESTSDEMLSASMTLTLRLIKVCIAMGGNVPGIRSALYRLLLECPEEGTTKKPN